MIDSKLKLYVNRDFVSKEIPYVSLLYPFWGTVVKIKTPYDQKTHKYGFDPTQFEVVQDINSADYLLMPHDYWKLLERHPDLLQKIIEEAQAYGKPILVDASGDVAGRVDVPNARILRINQYRFNLPGDEITVPVPCEDLLESYYGGRLVLREKGDVPIVGFVGWGRLTFKQRLRTLMKELPIRLQDLFKKNYKVYRKGVFWREQAIRVFGRSKKVYTNFIIRSSYSGHTNTLVGDPEKNRREFVENIFNSDYTLIVRGDANAATRFYETLALGRIPVFIDTACVLPLNDKINYKEFCVFINYTEINRAPEILAQFHKTISPNQFIAMQQKARYTFKNYLRYDAFSKHLVEMLRDHLSQDKNL